MSRFRPPLGIANSNARADPTKVQNRFEYSFEIRLQLENCEL